MSQMQRVAIVTGAGSGIGRATAELLGAAGWAVALVGRRRDPLEETAEGVDSDTLILPADLAREEGATGVVRATVEAFGRLDALINNAASAPMKPVPEFTWDELEALYRVNVLGVQATIAAAWPVFASQHGAGTGPGRVVSVSSMATADPFPGLSTYAATKAAINLLTRGVALEGAESGILAFAVAPGAVETAMLRAIADEKTVPPSKTLDPADVARVIADCALGRRDEDNGDVIFIPSPE